MTSLNEKYQSEVSVLQDKMVTTEKQHLTETGAFREQIKQHALTIVSLEDKIIKSGKDLAKGQAKVVELQQKLSGKIKKARPLDIKYITLRQFTGKPVSGGP